MDDVGVTSVLPFACVLVGVSVALGASNSLLSDDSFETDPELFEGEGGTTVGTDGVVIGSAGILLDPGVTALVNEDETGDGGIDDVVDGV